MASQPITPLTYRGPFFPEDIKEPLVLKRLIATRVALYLIVGSVGDSIPLFIIGLLGFFGLNIPHPIAVASLLPIPVIALAGVITDLLPGKSITNVLSREGISEMVGGETVRFSPWGDIIRISGGCVFTSHYKKPFFLDPVDSIATRNPAWRFLQKKSKLIMFSHSNLKPKSYYAKWLVAWGVVCLLSLICGTIFVLEFPPELIFETSAVVKAAWLLSLILLVSGSIGGLVACAICSSYLQTPTCAKPRVATAPLNKSSSEVDVFVNMRKGWFSPVKLLNDQWYRYLDESVIWRCTYSVDEIKLQAILAFYTLAFYNIEIFCRNIVPVWVIPYSVLVGVAVLLFLAQRIRSRGEFKSTKEAQFRATQEGGTLIRLASGKDVHATILPHRRWPAGSPRFFGSRTIRLHGDDGRYYRYDLHFLVPILPGRVTVKF